MSSSALNSARLIPSPAAGLHRQARRIRIGEALIGFAFIGIATVLVFEAPKQQIRWAPALICLFMLALAANVQFETPFGSTVATQVPFVPLMFVMPLGLVPVAVAVAMVAASIPAIKNGAPVGEQVTRALNASWFTIGPVAVFTLLEVQAEHASPRVLVLALFAQFAVNLCVALVRSSLTGSGWLAELIRGSWVFAVDAALFLFGYVVALATKTDKWAPLALLPILALLAIFGHERESRISGLVELQDAYEGTARVLGNVIEADDEYTGEHSQDVLQLCRQVGERMRLSESQMRALEFGALLHDVGKVRVPKEIINKRGPLNDAEWQIVRTHPVEGQHLLDMVGGFMSTVGVVVRAHHERWDGNGYPDGLAGNKIPIEARIISCCDTWNAMQTNRSYRKSLSFEAAAKEMRAVAGSQLDPNVVDNLLAVVRRLHATTPQTSAVHLATALVEMTAGPQPVARPAESVAPAAPTTAPSAARPAPTPTAPVTVRSTPAPATPAPALSRAGLTSSLRRRLRAANRS